MISDKWKRPSSHRGIIVILLPSETPVANQSPRRRRCGVQIIIGMKLAKLLNADHIFPEMRAHDHRGAIVELVDHLVKTGQLPPDQREETLQAFGEREELLSTGIGSGVAIPHVFSDSLERVVAVFGRSRMGVEFNAVDRAPVHFIVLFIVPRKDYHLHLRTLAAIAKVFTNDAIRCRLGAASTVEEILAIFEAKPSRGAADRLVRPIHHDASLGT